jgi:hypothetical protein
VKQILQHLRTGATEVADVPAPALKRGHLLIRTSATLLSAGTEKMLVNFGQASLIGKARSQPDKVKQVLEKIGTDGLMPTVEAVFNKLDQPLALGYCNVGVVIGRSRRLQRQARRDRQRAEEPLRQNPGWRLGRRRGIHRRRCDRAARHSPRPAYPG